MEGRWNDLDLLLDKNFTYTGDGYVFTKDEYIGFMQDMKAAFSNLKMVFPTIIGHKSTFIRRIIKQFYWLQVFHYVNLTFLLLKILPHPVEKAFVAGTRLGFKIFCRLKFFHYFFLAAAEVTWCPNIYGNEQIAFAIRIY